MDEYLSEQDGAESRRGGAIDEQYIERRRRRCELEPAGRCTQGGHRDEVIDEYVMIDFEPWLFTAERPPTQRNDPLELSSTVHFLGLRSVIKTGVLAI